MFEQTILAGTVKTRKAWTVPVCFAGQLVAVGCLALIPLIFFDGLPQGQLAPPRLTVPGTYHPPKQQSVQLVSTGSHAVRNALVPPARIPDRIYRGPDLPAAPPDPAPECTGVCVFNSLGPSDPVPTARPIAPEPRQTEVATVVPRATPTPAPIRVSVGVQEAKLIHRVTPVYPPAAIRMRISGSVHMEAIIGADGRIRELRVLSGHPFLVQAAVNAVREWVYSPTMLSGAPVEVMTDIMVTFYLK